MRVRIHLASGFALDVEEFSTDNGASWQAIEVPHIAAVMANDTGYTVVRDTFGEQWRALRNERIESIGPPADLTSAIEAEVERRIARILAERLPARVEAVVPVTPIEPPAETPPA